MVAPYRDSTPPSDGAPRVRSRWALREDGVAFVFACLWLVSALMWCACFIPFGLCPFVVRWIGVEVALLALWVLVFVTREPVS